MASTSLAFDIIARDRASRTFNDVGKAAGRAESTFTRVGRTMARVGRIAATGMVVGLGAAAVGMRSAVEAASDLGETTSKAAQILGDDAMPALERFAEGAASALGQSKQSALDAAATFAVFGKAAGLQDRALVGFSTQLTSLASDMASFANTSPEEAITAIGAALRGESEPIRRYGVLLDDASMRQEALRLGLIKTTKEALTPQQKVLAAQALILKQTGDAQGDFARTSGGLANQQRILRAQLENTRAEIGEKLLPVITKIAVWINEQGIPALRRFGHWFSNEVLPRIKRVAAYVRDELGPVLLNAANVVLPAMRDAVKSVAASLNDVRKAFGGSGESAGSFGETLKKVIPVTAAFIEGGLKLVAVNVRILSGAFILLTANIRYMVKALKEALRLAAKAKDALTIDLPGFNLGTPGRFDFGGGGSSGSSGSTPAPKPRTTRPRGDAPLSPRAEEYLKSINRAVTRPNRVNPLSAGWAAS